MKKIILSLLIFVSSLLTHAQHNAGNNGKVLMIASNKSTSQQTGWPIGVWYAELTHPYWIFSEAGYTVEIASLEGGELFFDGFSDPEDASKYAAFDYISLGFKKDVAKMALVKNTLKLSNIKPSDYKEFFDLRVFVERVHRPLSATNKNCFVVAWLNVRQLQRIFHKSHLCRIFLKTQ